MSKPRRIKTRDSRTGEMVEGTVIDIINTKEPFSLVELANGTEIHIRMAFSQVVRLDTADKDGKPEYNIISQMMVNVHHADESEESTTMVEHVYTEQQQTFPPPSPPILVGDRISCKNIGPS